MQMFLPLRIFNNLIDEITLKECFIFLLAYISQFLFIGEDMEYWRVLSITTRRPTIRYSLKLGG